MPKRKRTDDEASRSTKETADLHHSVLGGLKDPTLDSRISGEETDNEEGITHVKIPFGDKSIVCEKRGGNGRPALIFTHGAGGGVANPATRDFAAGFALTSPLICFQGTMNLQNRVKTFHATVEHQLANTTPLGGRSMGARAAVLTAQELDQKPTALILVSYPLTGGKNGDKREQSRERILLDLPGSVDVLFVFGSEDAQCNQELLEQVTARMKAMSWYLEVKGADHSMSLKDKRGVQKMRMWTGAIAARWLENRDTNQRYSSISWDGDNAKVVHEDWHGGRN